MNHILLIGAGGTGAAIAPTLAVTYDGLTIVDGDVYEEKNMARQPNTVIGMHKADVLHERTAHLGDVIAINKFVDGTETFKDIDLIISCVDNNEARLAVAQLADSHKVPLIICGNETWDPMAWLYLPELKHTKVDPYIRWSLGELRDPIRSCEDEDNPPEEQTAPANYVAGAMALAIMESMKTDNKKIWLAEAACTPNPRYKTVKQILTPPKPVEA